MCHLVLVKLIFLVPPTPFALAIGTPYCVSNIELVGCTVLELSKALLALSRSRVCTRPNVNAFALIYICLSGIKRRCREFYSLYYFLPVDELYLVEFAV